MTPHVEVFLEDGTGPGRWGFQCFVCGFEQTGVTDLFTAEEHADTHRCLAPADSTGSPS